ncbi:hypothetical protein D3C86_1885280 [compost metagenome]
MEDPTIGVNAGVLYMAGKIETNLSKVATPAVEFEAPPEIVPEPEQPDLAPQAAEGSYSP